MIKTFSARNYRCIRDVTAHLTPLHAFIGPNDSGKSTLLHGLRTLIQFAGGAFVRGADGAWQPFDPDLPERHPAMVGQPKPHEVSLACEDVRLACEVEGGSYALEMTKDGLVECVPRGDGTIKPESRGWDNESAYRLFPDASTAATFEQLRSAQLVRFDPDALRAPSGLIPESQRAGFLDDQGHGLPGVFFALRNRSDDALSVVVEDARRHFPTLKAIRFKPITSGTLVLEAELQNGVWVGANRMSEGLLYYLAFAALQHLDPATLLLIEEPENGLHPARIAEVVRMLRVIVEEMGTQVIIATHSPLVINELQPEEVTVVTRPSLEEGTQLTPMIETHNFQKRSSVYALGELWLSFANGIDEGPLLRGRGE